MISPDRSANTARSALLRAGRYAEALPERVTGVRGGIQELAWLLGAAGDVSDNMPTSEGAAPSSLDLNPEIVGGLQGGPVFVIDDILFTYIVLPYLTRLLNQSRDQLYDWLDKQGVKLAKSVFQPGRTDLEVLNDVGYYVQENSKMARTLARAAVTTEFQDADKLPAAQSDEAVLKVVYDVLTGSFEMVQKLGHPVVLPGFLTGTDDLVVIDVRTVPPDRQLKMPRFFGYNSPAIQVIQDPPPPLAVNWTARLWLVRAPTDADRRRCEELVGDGVPTAPQLAEELEDQLLVTRITRDHVVGKHARQVVDGLPPVLQNPSSQIPWAQTPDGVKAMLAALTTKLANELGEQQQKNELWIQALTAPSA